MTYATKDLSVHSGKPFECYEFAGSNGTFRYTSYQEDVTLAGDVYTALPVTRTSVETSSIVNSPVTMDFNLPITSEVASRYCFGVSPKVLNVTVYRAHVGDDLSSDYQIEWKGYLLNVVNAGKWVTLKTGSILRAKLNGNLSSVLYQRSCNHILYDERCKVVEASFTTSGDVTKVQGLKVTVDNDGVADNVLDGGKVVNTRTGEERDIYSNAANVLIVGYAFIDILVGDTLDMIQGCDHSRLGDCKTKFNNVVNYGGFDFIPEKNPFANPDNLNSVVTNVRKDRVRKFTEWTVSGTSQ